jgi:FtsP/CotA-like multicopper oxidase with cupredoxin domain
VAVSSQAAKKFSSAEPIRLKLGERALISVINYTMMDHPIHLHGLWNALDNGHGEFRSYKHTINVKGGRASELPGQRRRAGPLVPFNPLRPE